MGKKLSAQMGCSPSKESVEPKCERCQATATKRCSRCKAAWYCSRKCQVEDWKDGHASSCKPQTSGGASGKDEAVPSGALPDAASPEDSAEETLPSTDEVVPGNVQTTTESR